MHQRVRHIQTDSSLRSLTVLASGIDNGCQHNFKYTLTAIGMSSGREIFGKECLRVTKVCLRFSTNIIYVGAGAIVLQIHLILKIKD